MDQLPLHLPNPPTTRRRGRPPGSRNRRSIDLARYIEATFAGSTPGQQAAQLAMVTPKDLRDARRQAQELGIVHLDLPPFELAMVVKAARLARALGCDRRDAWLLLQKEREALMPYVHQKQPQAADAKGKAPATVFLIPEGEANQVLADFTPRDDDEIDFIDDLAEPPAQVSRAKSHGAP